MNLKVTIRGGGFRVTLQGGLREGTLAEGFQVPSGTFRGGFRRVILRKASKYFQRGVKGGVPERGASRYLQVGLTGGVP